MANKKHIGQVFTPQFLVCDILDTAGYQGTEIEKKHIIDNSCGDGAFLTEIVRRYINNIKIPKQQLIIDLQTYIHGIEIDPIAYQQCIQNLDNIAHENGLNNIKWDILNQDTLTIDNFNTRMDFVVGNPPYVRVHNLENYDTVKNFKFAEDGMTDLYLVFFEIGFNMLKKGGKLCYITPSSWINSVAGSVLRQYILQHHNLIKLIDLEHFQAFDATTYTMISLFQKDIEHQYFTYCTYQYQPQPTIIEQERLTIEQTIISGMMYLADLNTLNELRDIYTTTYKQFVKVKNGFATLADSIFIKDNFPFEQYVIPTIKASTGKWYKAFFPYDHNGKPLPKEQIFNNQQIALYLEQNKQQLLKGDTEQNTPDWYLYGRTQALKDVWLPKYTINTIVKNIQSIKINKVQAGSGVYSGLYILTSVNQEILTKIIRSQEFINYIATLKKYKSGGYYTFNSRELELYLNYKLSNYLNDKSYVKQQNLFENYF